MLHYIIDAFNVTRCGAAADLHRSGDEHRDLLAYIHENSLTGSPRNRVTIVFDGYQPEGFCNHYPGLTVRFSNSGKADPLIMDLVRGHENPGILVVVSDDREIQEVVRSCGGKAMGSAGFLSRKSARPSHRRAPEAGGKNKKMEREITRELSELWLDEE